jgi:hypothetical protein
LVADGYLTDIPLGSVYSGVVILRGGRIVLFLAETDIGNAYWKPLSEEVYIIAGLEVGE